VAPTPDGVFSRAIDTSRKMALVGPCPVDWRTGLRMMAEDRHPDLSA
jgi:hypothetical protein